MGLHGTYTKKERENTRRMLLTYIKRLKKAVDENFSYTKSEAQREENFIWDYF
jgi:hypothetical protein